MRISDWSSDVCSSDLGMVSVMTMHQSKGLEFPFVFVGHLGDNASPESTHELEDMFGVFPNLSGRNFTALSADMRAELDTVRKRSEERRVGKECVSTCRSRWSTYH